MTKRQYRQYEMLVRVRNFGDTHKEQFAEGSEGAKSFASITAAVAQIDAFTNDKLTARRESTKEKLAAKRSLAARIGAIARSARVLAKTVPGADAKFPLPPRRSDVAVLQTGRLFLEEVEPVKDAFIGCGLRPTFVEDLRQAVARLEQAISRRSEAKAAAAVAQKGVRSAIKKAVDTVMSLDVLIANTLGHDEHVMNAWKRLRHVELADRSVSIDAPAESGGSMPSSADEQPTPPATNESPAVAAEPTQVEEPLRRAS
jgi:hypothetical protein